MKVTRCNIPTAYTKQQHCCTNPISSTKRPHTGVLSCSVWYVCMSLHTVCLSGCLTAWRPGWLCVFPVVCLSVCMHAQALVRMSSDSTSHNNSCFTVTALAALCQGLGSHDTTICLTDRPLPSQCGKQVCMTSIGDFQHLVWRCRQ